MSGRIQGRGGFKSNNTKRGGKTTNSSTQHTSKTNTNNDAAKGTSSVSDGYTSPFAHLVVHSKDKNAPHDVYIGRPGPYGNPFVIGKDGEREDVILKYKNWLLNTPDGKIVLEQARKELPGKILGCWCAPLACHGHVLAELVNTTAPTTTATNTTAPTATTATTTVSTTATTTTTTTTATTTVSTTTTTAMTEITATTTTVDTTTTTATATTTAPVAIYKTPNGKFTVPKDGVVLIRNAFSIEEQQEIVNLIAKYGRGQYPECGSFYGTAITKKDGYVDPDPADSDPTSGKLNLGTKARMNIPFDKAPSRMWELCEPLLNHARKLSPSIPSMNPTVWRVNYYKTSGKIGWHTDRHPKVADDLQHTVKSPVISVTIGNAGTFDFKDNSSVENHDSVKLSSGDVIIFGGPARMLYHRMIKVWNNTSPLGLNLYEFTGRFNFAFYDN